MKNQRKQPEKQSRKGVKNLSLKSRPISLLGHFPVAPLRRSWVAQLRRSLTVAKYYRVDRGDIVHSRRGHFNEARNVAIYLVRKLRGNTLKEIGNEFGMDQYSTVSSVVERMKALVKNDKRLEKRINHLLSVISKSQEQT